MGTVSVQRGVIGQIIRAGMVIHHGDKVIGLVSVSSGQQSQLAPVQ